MRTLDGHIKIFFLATLVKLLFAIETKIISIRSVNHPEKFPCILALWHAHQCVLYNFKHRDHLHVLISRSNDGEIIAQGVESVGIHTVRGSQKRNAVSATLELIDKLNQGENIAITVDGPRGPKRVVKEGVINIAKNSGVPIIPLVWYSDHHRFLKFNTWDEFRFPIWTCETIAVYGDPIYIPEDADKEQVKEYAKVLENKMLEMYQDLKLNYKEYEKKAYSK